jgi:lipopolysaccharide export LptBFGC system permease protein LptF
MKVNKMVKVQVRALLIFFIVALFGFLAMGINVREIMASENPHLMIAVFQIPMAAAGIYLGLVLMWAGRNKEKQDD